MFKGWVKNSLVDYPGKVATTLFTQGCNFLCPYCHNGDLVLAPHNLPEISTSEIMAFLNKRKGLIDAVCISGGEPLLHNDLDQFLEEVRELGYLIKLDTNGYFPHRLAELLERNLVDYLAMDVKNCPEKYPITTGLDILDYSPIKSSIDLIIQSSLPHEFRTTISKDFHTPQDILSLAKQLKGAKKFVLQQYRHADKQISDTKFVAYSPQELGEIKQELAPLFPEVQVRGI